MGALKVLIAYLAAMIGIFGGLGLMIMAFQIPTMMSFVVAGVAIGIFWGGISIAQKMDN